MPRSALLLLISCFTFAGCAMEKSTISNSIETRTLYYEVSEEELGEYIRKDENGKHFRFLRPRHAIQTTLEIKLDREVVKSIVLTSLEEVGLIVGIPETDPAADIMGVIDVGFLIRDRTVVWIWLEEESNVTVVSVLAFARKPSIKVNAKGRAMERLILSLEEKAGLDVKIRKLDS